MSNYPKYYDYGGLNKLINRDSGLSVIDDNSELSVQFLKDCCPSDVIVKNGKEVDKSVFDNALQSALSKLNAMVQMTEKSYMEPIVNAMQGNAKPDIFNQIADIVGPDYGNDADDLIDVNI